MRKKLIDRLREVIEAERAAGELRRTLGEDAERYCDAIIFSQLADRPERERLEDVRRALRWI